MTPVNDNDNALQPNARSWTPYPVYPEASTRTKRIKHAWTRSPEHSKR
jgi:hypothetical protein